MSSTSHVMAEVDIHTESVDYEVDGVTYEGYLAYDKSLNGERPGVVIFHQWMGLTDYEKGRARQLAELGYVAFAADVYGKGVRPSNAGEASAQSGIVKSDVKNWRRLARMSLSKIRDFDMVAKNKVAAIGYCFGGSTVIELARAGGMLSGAVSFHGGLSASSPEDAAKIKCPILVLHGADDPYVPAESLDAFRQEMKDADIDMTFIAFPNAVHAFTQPMAGNDNSKGAAYNAKADHRSWEYMIDFFDEIF